MSNLASARRILAATVLAVACSAIHDDGAGKGLARR